MENPFKYGGVVRGPYFADRRSEIKELKRGMVNLNQVFLVSPRRFGKTCLLLNLIETLKREGMACAYIEQGAYAKFVLGWLRKGGYTVNDNDLKRIFEIGNDVPYNIQRLCNVMWDNAMETKTIKPALIEKLPVIIAQQDSPYYEMLWRSASQPQKILLIALSRDQTAKPFSKDFQLKHGIGPSSSIKASFDSLVKKGILFKTLQGGYQFDDGFMLYWIDYIRKTIR
ncbi:MAG: hypothetical protein JRJ41_07300 [Deltaproteobacteria bacterium]|nr:hypothetical protein [Deltaproteobacteria bacterium]